MFLFLLHYPSLKKIIDILWSTIATKAALKDLIVLNLGLPVKPLVYVKRKKVDIDQLYDYVSGEDDSTDEDDEDWMAPNATLRKKKESNESAETGLKSKRFGNDAT